jgi:ribosome-associated toxin RatA of RatAB toxin-antitoxin module
MATIINEIAINAPIGKIWEALSDVAELEKYDPTVKKSTCLSKNEYGIGAKRKVDMQDGKNWFEEICTIWQLNEALTYELTACSFPVHRLRHSYSFTKKGDAVIVRQEMNYTVKFGVLGQLLDFLMIRKRSDAGVKKFFTGLKSYAEKHNG